ncbi:MAG: nucleotidyltransferase family protein [Acidobacteria bacterium]|nr:nucleotidyltransferase family protein [Acidobacteriota bacterium]
MPVKSKTRKAVQIRNEILELLRQHQDTLDEQFTVKRIGLFGSFARNEQHKRSDVDFVVEFARPSYDNYFHLIDYLEKLFGRKVQIITPDCLDSIRVKKVAREIRKSVVYV